MTHILFADMSQAGLLTMRRAVDLGYDVSLIRGAAVQFYKEDDAFRHLTARLDQVTEIPDTSDADALTSAIEDVRARRPIDAVISQCDPMMEALAAACERLSLRYTAARGIRNARDKARGRAVLADAHVAGPRFAVVHDAGDAVRAADQIGYPVVVKPVSGMDSVLACRARDRSDARRAAAGILAAAADPRNPAPVRKLLRRGVLVEEYLNGRLVSAEVGMMNGNCYRFLVAGRSRARDNDCIEIGAVLPANIGEAEASECLQYAENVCRLFGLDFGVFHVELMLTADGPMLVEVNPRVMGGVMTRLYEILTGVDFCDYVIDLHLGREPTIAAVPAKRTITARRIMPDVAGRISPALDLSRVINSSANIVNFENFHLTPGTEVTRQQILGRFAVLDSTWSAAMSRANELMIEFERELGLPLIQPEMLSTAR